METFGRRSESRSFGLAVLTIVCSGLLFAQTVSVTIPPVSAPPNTPVSIPINVSSLTGLNVTAFEFIVTCDSTVMSLDGAESVGTLSSAMSVLTNNFAGGFGSGRMKVVAASSGSLSGPGVLIYIQGTTKNKAGSSNLGFASGSFIFNAGGAGDPQPSITVGTVRVNRPPSITPVGAQTIAQGDSLFFIVTAADLDLPNDTLTFSMSSAPAGASITKTSSTTANFGWRPNFTQIGPFAVRLKVTDTGGAADSSAIVQITVTKTNVKPNFINKMRDTVINQGQTLSFTYTASDVNGDPLTFNLLSPPTGATMTSAGVFTWRPVYPLVGPTPITAMVSDGLLQDVAAATVTVTRVNQKPVINSRVPASVTQISAGKPQTFSVSATDPNGDPITYKWVVNNQVIKTGPDSSYTTTFTDPHNTLKLVTAVCADPDGLSDSTMWVFTITDIETDKSVVPSEFALGQNFPNPFNPTTTLQFDLPKSSSVTLEIFNVTGVRVRSLLKGENISAGSHMLMWDGRDSNGRVMPSGVYLYRITAGDFHAWRKMTLLK